MTQPTARARILAKPETVQVVLKAFITKQMLADGAGVTNSEYERYGEQALQWWGQIETPWAALGGDKSELAERVVAGLRKQEVWGKILRGNSQ